RRQSWAIQSPRITGRIALLPLLHKELRILRLSGVAPQIWVQRAESELASPPPREDAMRLAFEDVRVDSPLRLQLGDTLIEGNARARGSWLQQLRGGRFELRPSTLELDKAQISHGDRAWIDAGTLSLAARIDPHLRREHRGLAILDVLTLNLKLDARGPGFDLRVDEHFKPKLALRPGAGHLDARLAIDHGALADGSEISLTVPLDAQGHAGVATQGDAHIALTALPQAIGLELDLPPIPDLVQRLEARMQLSDRRLPLPPWSALLPRINGEIDLDARFTSLDFVQPLLDRLHGIHLDGRGAVEGRVSVKSGQLAEGTELSVDDAEFTLDAWSHRFRGQAHALATLASNASGVSGAQARVTLDQFAISPLAAPDQALGTGRSLTLDLVADGNLQQLRESMRAHLRFQNARLPDLRRFNRYLPSQGVRLLAGSGHVSADMQLDVGRARNGGRFSLSAQAANIGMGEMVMRGDVTLDAHLEAGQLTDKVFRMPGTRLVIRKAAILEPAGERVDDWWATAHVRDGRMSLEQPMDVSALADVKLRDVAPLLSIYARKKQLPAWLRRVVDAGEATAGAQLRREGDCMVIEDLAARNARFDVLGRLRLCAGPPSGQLYARWGILGMGLELERGQRQFHLKGAKSWFESQPRW
ncbi:MAG TPA: hypothetical protein VFN29_12980, partial [Chiayiivirga sp.]|nr:hypothetical protein [Chiayiivirga sp.]